MKMLSSGAVLRLPSGSSGISASTSTTMSSHICGTQLPVIGAWSYPVPSTISGGAGSVNSEMKSIAVTPGEYLVSHVVNGKPLMHLNSSTVNNLVGQPLAPVFSTTVSSNARHSVDSN